MQSLLCNYIFNGTNKIIQQIELYCLTQIEKQDGELQRSNNGTNKICKTPKFGLPHMLI